VSDLEETAQQDSDEVARLKTRISRLEVELECHQKASNSLEAAPGFIVDTKYISAEIGNTGQENPPTARVHHFVAVHVESGWESEHYLDKNHAIRRTWERHLEMKLEALTAERDELKRRWEQRKKTQAAQGKVKGNKEDDKGEAAQ